MGLLGILKALGSIGGAVKSFFNWLNANMLKKAGRTERDLEVQKETVEVISRNAEGQQAVDQMTEEELDKFLPKK